MNYAAILHKMEPIDPNTYKPQRFVGTLTYFNESGQEKLNNFYSIIEKLMIDGKYN